MVVTVRVSVKSPKEAKLSVETDNIEVESAPLTLGRGFDRIFLIVLDNLLERNKIDKSLIGKVSAEVSKEAGMGQEAMLGNMLDIFRKALVL